MNVRIAFKLMTVRKDGSIGPLFCNAKQRVPIGVRLTAELHKTSGLLPRKGWHCTAKPVAPHLTEKGRAWFVVGIEDYVECIRPEHQGGLWFVAQAMTVVRPLSKG